MIKTTMNNNNNHNILNETERSAGRLTRARVWPSGGGRGYIEGDTIAYLYSSDSGHAVGVRSTARGHRPRIISSYHRRTGHWRANRRRNRTKRAGTRCASARRDTTRTKRPSASLPTSGFQYCLLFRTIRLAPSP